MSKTVQVPANVVTAISYLHGGVSIPAEVEAVYFNLVSEWLATRCLPEKRQSQTVRALKAHNAKTLAQPTYEGYSVAWPKLERDW